MTQREEMRVWRCAPEDPRHAHLVGREAVVPTSGRCTESPVTTSHTHAHGHTCAHAHAHAHLSFLLRMPSPHAPASCHLDALGRS